MAASDPRAKLLALVDALEELAEKEKACRAEMAMLLSGEAGIGTKLKSIKAAVCSIWTERHKEPMAFDHVKHTAFLKKKLLTHSDTAIVVKYQHYVSSDEAYYVRARHPFGLFMTSFDSWKGIPAEVPADNSDRLRELRGQ